MVDTQSTQTPAKFTETEDVYREQRTTIAPVRDIAVGFVFLAVALVRFVPPFNTSVPSTGLLWYGFIGVYGLYRVCRGIIKFGSR